MKHVKEAIGLINGSSNSEREPLLEGSAATNFHRWFRHVVEGGLHDNGEIITAIEGTACLQRHRLLLVANADRGNLLICEVQVLLATAFVP